MHLVFYLIPRVISRVEVRALCIGKTSSWTLLCAQEHSYSKRFGFLVLAKINVNVTAFKDILSNWVIPILWQQFRKIPYTV